MRNRASDKVIQRDAENFLSSGAAMQLFYNIFPYPNRPIVYFPNSKTASTARLGFLRALSIQNFSLARSCWQKSKRALTCTREELHDLQSKCSANDRILLVGCGTDEPLLFRTLHPKASITAVDLSERSIGKAKKRLALYNLVHWTKCKTKFHVEDFCKLNERDLAGPFQLVQCFGVLHHQEEPWFFLDKLIKNTAPGGFLRIMVYSSNGRRLERRIQKDCSKLWENHANLPNIMRAHRKLWLWQFANRLGIWGKSTQMRFRYLGNSPRSIADALMHPSDHSMDIEKIVKNCRKKGLELIFCEAKITEKGWVAGIEDPHSTWLEILNAEKKCEIISNILITFERKQKPAEQL